MSVEVLSCDIHSFVKACISWIKLTKKRIIEEINLNNNEVADNAGLNVCMK